jgi:hypothetical protein
MAFFPVGVSDDGGRKARACQRTMALRGGQASKSSPRQRPAVIFVKNIVDCAIFYPSLSL